jgi:hypothetical protein
MVAKSGCVEGSLATDRVFVACMVVLLDVRWVTSIGDGCSMCVAGGVSLVCESPRFACLSSI